jgi:hypothetical protein
MKTRKGYRYCPRCDRNRAEKFFKPRGRYCSTCIRKRVSYSNRDTRLIETYGITNEEYALILAAQGGKCAICLRTYGYNLDIDHSHQMVNAGVPARMTIRGLLCKRCNRKILPASEENPGTLYRAAQYVAADVSSTVAQEILRT